MIDASVLKGHVSSGVTLSAKNLFGLTSIDPDWHKNAHNGFTPKRDGTPSYSAFVDYLGHKDMGGKTVLFLMDALYANDLVDDPPHLKWKMARFNGQWRASLVASQDGVALDSVSLDFLRSEWPNLADLSYCDDYMRESALAEAPSSGGCGARGAYLPYDVPFSSEEDVVTCAGIVRERRLATGS